MQPYAENGPRLHINTLSASELATLDAFVERSRVAAIGSAFRNRTIASIRGLQPEELAIFERFANGKRFNHAMVNEYNAEGHQLAWHRDAFEEISIIAVSGVGRLEFWRPNDPGAHAGNDPTDYWRRQWDYVPNMAQSRFTLHRGDVLSWDHHFEAQGWLHGGVMTNRVSIALRCGRNFFEDAQFEDVPFVGFVG